MKLLTFKKDLSSRNEVMVRLTNKVDLKANKANFEELLERFDNFSEVETISKLQTHYLPKIDRFTKHIDKFQESNIEMRECIKKLDSDISLKWSKSAMTTLVDEIEKTYMKRSHLKDFEEQIAVVEKQVVDAKTEFRNEISAYKERVSGIVSEVLNTSVSQRFHKYEKVAKGFEKFFNAEALSAILDKKADAEQLLRIH